MLLLPVLPADIIAALLRHCCAAAAPLCSRRVWRHVPLLVVGAILAPGQRMVSSALRAVGVGAPPTFQTDPRVLNRAAWSSLGASRIRFDLLVATGAPTAPLVVGIDETLARRRGRTITAAGIDRDPVRSRHRQFVKVRGLRWIRAPLLVPIPWAARVWALPCLTVLAPSERAARRRQRRFKPLTTWARQMSWQLHRWAPTRRLVVVGDRTDAALEVLNAVRPVTTMGARLRLDARLLTPPPPRMPGQRGRPRLVGDRLPNRTVQAQAADATWRRLTVARWYGARERPVEVRSQTAVWYSTGFPPVPIRWVLIPLPATRGATLPPKPCAARTSMPLRCRASRGSSCAGNAK